MVLKDMETILVKENLQEQTPLEPILVRMDLENVVDVPVVNHWSSQFRLI